MTAHEGESEPGSVTGWYLAFQRGDSEAAAHLFDSFFERMIRQAGWLLGHGRRPDAANDAEDLALSALDSFFAVVRRGGVDRIRDRHSLWSLLHKILKRKVYDRLSRKPPPEALAPEALEPVVDRELPPDLTVELRELLETCLGLLDETNRRIAMLHLDGHSLSEIAKQVDKSKSVVGLRLQEIYKTWRRRFGEEAA